MLGSEEGITLVPACKQVSGGACTPAGNDPGVFAVASTATGQVGTSVCGHHLHGRRTSIPCTGEVRFTPQPAGPRDAAGHGIGVHDQLHFSVIKSPTGDQDPVARR